MKTFLIIAFSLFTGSLFAQKDTATISTNEITSVQLIADGLTCSMCSKSIYKSLLKIPAVNKVDPDIENSGFTIYFKKDQVLKTADLEKAVVDAGFSVGSLKINKVPKNKAI